MQHCLLAMTEKCTGAVDYRGNKFGTFLTSPLLTNIISSYLSNRTQRTKIIESVTTRSHKVHGVLRVQF